MKAGYKGASKVAYRMKRTGCHWADLTGHSCVYSELGCMEMESKRNDETLKPYIRFRGCYLSEVMLQLPEDHLELVHFACEC